MLDALAGTLLTDVRNHLPAPPPRTVVTGQSLGGLAALAFGAWHPEAADRILAYSPSVWFRPGLHARPADVSGRQEWIHEQLRDAGRSGCHTAPADHGGRRFRRRTRTQCGRAAGTADNCGFPITFRTYSGGHDDCWWAAMLLDDLAADTRRDTLPDDTDTGC